MIRRSGVNIAQWVPGPHCLFSVRSLYETVTSTEITQKQKAIDNAGTYRGTWLL